jgi:hypothetical protein
MVDAADEFLPPSKAKESSHSSWSHRKALLETLMQMQKDGKGKIKVLITSRPMMEIQSTLKNVSRISMSGESNSDDIMLYVTAQLIVEMENGTDWGEKLTAGEQQTPTIKSRIVSKLVQKANGM